MVVRGVPARRRRCVRVSLLAIVVACVLSTREARAAELSPIGVHSMLYLTHPFGAKRAMFREAAAAGASTIRVDVELPAIFPAPPGAPDWSGVDQYIALARTYHLRVLADLTGTPWYMADCPAGTPFDATYLCPPVDPRAWGQVAGAVAAHTRGVIDDFEIINEPDGGWAFHGTAQQYAGILAASYDAIHAADPRAQVALGGLENVGTYGVAWLNQVFATPGAEAIHKFDIANIHVRTPESGAAPTVARWRRYFASAGFRGPLWVTETGYPADPAYQTDPGYRNGATSQAKWMSRVIPAMLGSGAAMVFVTERDSLTGRFASEGILQSADPLTADPQYKLRPSFYAVRALARRLAHTRRRRR
ncbi:MAG TPA: hypothetical protein VFI54_03895 [Solirubrobacteraceae bacterium]|nr:hypothetical protein [Solirubrobacteraceae bacterium]